MIDDLHANKIRLPLYLAISPNNKCGRIVLLIMDPNNNAIDEEIEWELISHT